jgi:hypothetical protein
MVEKMLGPAVVDIMVLALSSVPLFVSYRMLLKYLWWRYYM